MPTGRINELAISNDVYIPPAKFSDTPTGSFTENKITYSYWIFKSNSTITCTSPGLFDALIVAGGGAGGGASYVGGGGGGGYMSVNDAYILTGTYNIVVAASAATGAVGNASYIGSTNNAQWVAIGGATSSSFNSLYRGANGTGSDSGSGGASSPVQPFGTYFGGAVSYNAADGSRRGGGGAGAGGNGGDANGNISGRGGMGAVINIIPSTIASSASIGQIVNNIAYFGGGGAGGNDRAGYQIGVAGIGGGGTGAYGTGGNAIVNSGGGGGGSSGRGGSGFIIIRVVTG